MSEQEQDIFGEVNDTEAPQSQRDPTTELYHLPADTAEWFVAKKEFTKPKDVKDCTATLVARFLSWQIAPENQSIYMGSGVSTPGTLRNQCVVRYHGIPDGYGEGAMSGRQPCKLQFGESCKACEERNKAEKRIPRDKQPAGYFKDVIAPFKAKDKTVMLAEIWEQDDGGNWVTDHKIRVFEFANYVKTGRTFTDIINARANDADKRIRIDKKSYAGYVAPVALKLAFSWPTKAGKPEQGQFSTWTVTDATPFPVEAGGPDVMKFSKEWAMATAKHDPASWINRNAFPKLNWAEVGQWVYGVFSGAISTAPKVDLDTADFGQLLAVVEANKAKFDAVGLNTAEYDYSMVEPLRAIVKGVLHG
jgi:hypothetical protein